MGRGVVRRAYGGAAADDGDEPSTSIHRTKERRFCFPQKVAVASQCLKIVRRQENAPSSKYALVNSGGKETASASDFSFICSHQDSQTGTCASKSKLPALPQSPSAAPPAVAINIALRIDSFPLHSSESKAALLLPATHTRTFKIP